MRGIQFLTDDRGRKIAVLIDLIAYSGLWEDLYDSLIAKERAHEPRESIESVKRRLRRRSKFRG